MKTYIGFTVAFVAGAAVGALTSWGYLNDKYRRLADEEIESVKNAFRGEEDEDVENEPCEEPESVDYAVVSSISDYKSTIEATNYGVCFKGTTEKPGPVKTELVVEKPYVISPEEYGELDDYATISLTYYSDKILTDELDGIVDDIEETVGFESLGRFGEYEPDAVHVRNDVKKCDYEIILDNMRYSELIEKKPYKRGFYDEMEM